MYVDFTTYLLEISIRRPNLVIISSKPCSFSIVFGTYRFLRAPFGLSCTFENVQSLVIKVFSGILGASVNLCISRKSKEKHDHILKQMFERARKRNIKFILNEVQYHRSYVKYLGVKFFKGGMLPDLEQIQVTRQLRTQSYKTEL